VTSSHDFEAMMICGFNVAFSIFGYFQVVAWIFFMDDTLLFNRNHKEFRGGDVFEPDLLKKNPMNPNVW